ncbi:MAG: polysaccharide deacetylase family protein [Bacilli bacterium]
MKRVFEGIGLLSLICFSFFYTNKISSVIKDSDDIMIEIKEVAKHYKITNQDAIIKDNTIIPGLKGQEIDIIKSYKKMKQYNRFNDSLLVYKKINPTVSYQDKFDKYIISGNKNKKEVSLLFLVNSNDTITKTLAILDKNNLKATFFTDGYWFTNNNQMVIDLIKQHHNIGNLGYDLDYSASGVPWMNTIVTKIGKQNNTYCYNENLEALKLCQVNRSYSIKPSIIAVNPLKDVKDNLKNGSIIALEVNDKVLNELQLIINYINYKDLKIVNLETLLEE